MVSKLNIAQSEAILEPSGGEGHFIDAILRAGFKGSIDTFEISRTAFDTLSQKFIEDNVNINFSNTLWDEKLDEVASSGGKYDGIVGNPPYGAWLEPAERVGLKAKYDGIYSRETYSLFLYRCLSLLRPGGTLCFIIPDTFLFLHNHTKLRKTLFKEFLISEILIFPSKLFPGIAFGYSNLSIITIQKPVAHVSPVENTLIVKKGFRDSKEFQDEDTPHHVKVQSVLQKDVLQTVGTQLILDPSIKGFDLESMGKLGDIADCVTGIYTGDNTRFIGVLESGIKGGKNYSQVPKDQVDFNFDSLTPLKNGKKFIPILKGSSTSRFVRDSNPWVVQWDEEAHCHYSQNKKARFQNSKYYFRKGIAVPMVKSKNIRVTEFQGLVFDQSIVGIFPIENKYHSFILAFLNTKLATKLIHMINPTANNSANYLKRIPIPMPQDSDLLFISQLVSTLRANVDDDAALNTIEEYFENKFGLRPDNPAEQSALATGS